MNWLLFLKLIDNQYEVMQGGSNMVPTEEFDKVLPTTERIARQYDKIYFDGEKLNVKDGETLLTVDELNYIRDENDEININQQEEMKNIYDIES